MKRRLPPGVSAKQFQAAVRRLQDVVGSGWVLTDDLDIGTYLDAYTPFRGDEADEYVPSGAVAPTEARQVQQIVTIANEYKIPLWPISTGRNLGYGGSAPRMSGTMVLDLKRMDRVLEVDEARAYALVEPGVSYFDFYRYLRDHKLKVWLDCPDPGWGSLIGNAMDHGVGHTAFRDHFGAICGMEVVLPNGELMRTGSGALPGSKAWNTFEYGYGPHVAPMFGQGNFGIVTKAGFYLLPEPEAARSDHISVPRHEDVHQFLDIMSTLVADFTIDTSWSLTSPLLTSQDPEIKAAVMRSGGEPSAELDRLGREKGLGYWGTRVYFNGAPEVIDAKWEYVKRRVSAIPGAKFRAGNYFHFPKDYDNVKEGMDGDHFAKEAVDIPSLSIFTGTGASRSHGHIFFSPIIAMSGEELLRARKVFKKAYKDLGIEHYNQVGGWAWFRCNLILLYVQAITDDAEHNAKIRKNVKHLVKVAADNGWGEYRTAPVFMDDVMAAYSFNNHALLRYHETIKDALDPNGILAPGRSGIWPKHLRGRTMP